MTYRCLFKDEDGVQCQATSEYPYKDGWWHIPGIEGGFYCPEHGEALSFPVYFHDEDDDRAA